MQIGYDGMNDFQGQQRSKVSQAREGSDWCVKLVLMTKEICAAWCERNLLSNAALTYMEYFTLHTSINNIQFMHNTSHNIEKKVKTNLMRPL